MIIAHLACGVAVSRVSAGTLTGGARGGKPDVIANSLAVNEVVIDTEKGGQWQYQRLDDKDAMNGCVGADMNADTRTDLVCTGAGGKVRRYENRGK
jgi:hypothetical protein